MNISIFGDRKFSTMEQAGMLAVVMVIVLYGYVTKVHAPLARTLNFMEQKYRDTSLAVGRLRHDQSSGRTEGELQNLRGRLSAGRNELAKAETMIAQRDMTDALATKIFRMASEKGLLIEDYSKITDKGRLREFLSQPDDYELSYYHITLRGRFGLIVELLKGMQDMSKLAVPRKISVSMPDDGKPLKTEIWFSI